MKRSVIVILCIVACMFCAYSQSGIWSGNLEVQGVKIPLVFHFEEENPTVDSPAQGARGIPIQVSRIEADSISINIAAIGASFSGKCQGDKIAGMFSQWGVMIPLILAPGEKISYRPQTPRPPYPYSQKEVSFANGDAVLKGTLTMPVGSNCETPVVIMVTGSGLQNRDEEIFEHKPFAVLADALARNGIASLRYDDRGFGESTGDVVNCTTEDLKNDALAGINLLRQQFNKVGVLGHSEGGTIGFMLGADKDVDFIISMAGMIISGKETLLDQTRYALSQAGYGPQTVDEYCKYLTMAYDGDETVGPKVESSDLPIELKQNLLPSLWQLKTPYMQYFLRMDIREILKKINCPVLALNGTKDTQVGYEKNLDALTSGLSLGQQNSVMAMEGLNHLFQHCESGTSVEYDTIEETLSPEVLEIIWQWIKSL